LNFRIASRRDWLNTTDSHIKGEGDDAESKGEEKEEAARKMVREMRDLMGECLTTLGMPQFSALHCVQNSFLKLVDKINW
jgi:hypothetical protein